MSAQSQLAVEIIKGEDHVSIWVDANNNGVRDDDDVNIYVTSSGSLYTESPTFKAGLDALLKDRVRDIAVEYLKAASRDVQIESKLSELALELVVKAVNAEAKPKELPPLPVMNKH